MLDDIVLMAHGPPGPPLLLHVLIQLDDVLLGQLDHTGPRGRGELVVVWEGQECGVLAMMEPTTSFSHAVPFWRLTIMISPWCETVNDPPFRGPRCGRLWRG